MARSAKTSRSVWLLLLCLITGLMFGGLLGSFGSDYLPFLSWSTPTYGIYPPLTVDLDLLTFTVGLSLRLTVAGGIGMVMGFIAYRAL